MGSIALELQKTDYAGLSDQETAEKLDALTETVIVSRFGSFRTMAAILTEAEYDTLRAVLSGAAAKEQAAGGYLIQDMICMLELPGDEQGNGGGLDFGSAAMQARVDELCAAGGIPDAARKIKDYATQTLRPFAGIRCVDVASAKGR